MKTNIKKILIAAGIILIIVLICIGFTSRTIHYDGIMLEDGSETAMTIDIKYRRIDMLLGKMHGNIYIQRDDKNLYEYEIQGSLNILPVADLRFAGISRYSEMLNCYVFGSFYFDKEFSNIVIRASEYEDTTLTQELYSSDYNFIELVNRFIREGIKLETNNSPQ